MEQRRSRLVAPDATGLRARILSTGGLLTVAAMVLVVLVQLFPRQELIARLRAEKRNDELSVSYLANLLTSEPDNDELRILLAERHFALKQADRAEAVLATGHVHIDEDLIAWLVTADPGAFTYSFGDYSELLCNRDGVRRGLGCGDEQSLPAAPAPGEHAEGGGEQAPEQDL